MKKVLFAALLYASIIGCQKEETFPKEPVIETISFRITGDLLAEWVFSFTDGDGNLGSDSPMDSNYFQTLHISSPRFSNPDSTLELAGERLPKINTSGLSKGVEGEITRFIELDLYDFRSVDTVYFTAFVVDQSGNKSGVIQTPRFTLDPTIIY